MCKWWARWWCPRCVRLKQCGVFSLTCHGHSTISCADRHAARAGRYGAAQALRRKAGKGFYSSNCIVGQDVSLAEYCDAIAEAGVLVCEPGTFSYGLGALVLGRVIEVLHTKERSWQPLIVDFF